ncbi:MAG: cobalt ECF transporter T component CbiQ [Gammaproteobacteria bacterium]|nr:cobalt ECF transporter T component CbiQ [Gammaproteobacteria bacterium]
MALDIDRYAHVESPIQRWDPRFKIAALGLFVVGIALIKTIPVAVMALVLAGLILLLTALPFHFVWHGMSFVLIFLLPFFIVMPLSYPGQSAFEVLGLGFAWEGLRLATLIFTKAMAIVFVTFSMFGSSRFDVSMLALQHLKCPKIIVQMLLFTYRYTFVFLEEMERMFVSMRARGFIARTDGRTMKVMGHFVGTLLIRSFERTDRVYKAMLSKGYQGEFHSMVTFSAGGLDGIKAVIVLIMASALVALDYSGVFNQAVQGWY